LSASNITVHSYPDWYRIERDTEKIIKKLTTMKEIIPYLNNSDEYIRRLSILRINELRLKDSIVGLKELLDDPLETVGNKELAAWTIKVISNHWNTDLFITNKYLNNYSGTERYEDVCKVSIKDTLPSLKFDFTSSMLNSELNMESNDIRSSKDIDIDLPFSVKEWFSQYSHDILADLKALIIKLPILMFKGLKYAAVFVFGGLLFIFKTLMGSISKIKGSKENKESNEPVTQNVYSSHSNTYMSHSSRSSQDNELQALRNSFDMAAMESSCEEKISLVNRVKNTILSILYVLFAPIRFVIHHKKLSILSLAAIYCFLTFFPYGKALTYKYTGLDIMDEQVKAFNAVKSVVAYVCDEIYTIFDVTGNSQQVVAQTDEKETPEPVEIVEAKYEITAETGLNLRDGPDTSSKKLLQLPFKTVVTKEAENGTWFKIKTSDGITGWVSSKYLKEFRGE
jgi:hypothetical protein